VAKIAATLAKPNGFVHVPFGSEAAFLSPLPVEAIPGVGPKTHYKLLRRGVKTIGDLLGNHELRLRFLNLEASSQADRSHGHSIGNETTLDTPLKNSDKMEEVLWELVEEVGSRLRKEGSYTRCITVKIRYINFKTITRSRTLSTPTCFDREIFEVARHLLKRNLAHASTVRLLGVSASSLLSSGWQESIFDVQKRRSWEKLYRGIDQLRQKYGEETIGTAIPHVRPR
jgi:DNA polymerase-4